MNKKPESLKPLSLPRTGLAPMEGVTDFPARIWFYLTSAPEFISTPFLRITDDFPKQKIPEKWCPELLTPEFDELLPYRVIPQFMTPSRDNFIRTAETLLDKAAFVDLNCGCPAPKAVGKGAGSSLLQDTDYFLQFSNQIVQELGDQKVSIKIRSGYNNADNYSDIITGLKDLAIAQLTVHGRTRKVGYKGKSDWNKIEFAASTLSVPVIGSGDIGDINSLREKSALAPNISGAIIGRGGIRNPWIFEEFRTEIPTKIEFDCIPYVLAVFALLNHGHLNDPSSLNEAVRLEYFLEPAGTNTESWKKLYSRLSMIFFNKQIPLCELEFSSGILGRVKHIWGYLRSSCPQEYFEPKVMRAKSFSEWFTALQSIDRSRLYDRKEKISLIWNKQHDWMFSGEKKPV